MKRDAADFLVAEHGLPISKACAAVGISRTAFYRRPPSTTADEPVVDTLNVVVTKHPRWGFWKCFGWLRLNGWSWNHKRVLRVYRAMRLNLPRRTKRRVPKRARRSMEVPAAANVVWSVDFMSDALYHGRRFRTLNVFDEGVREVLEIVIDTSIPSGRVARTLEQLRQWRGIPTAIRCDNGPELLGEPFVAWCRENEVEIHDIQPGKPNQNAYIERFNRTYRSEVLNAYLFETLGDVRRVTDRWLVEYNEERPHDALGRTPPRVFREALEKEVSTLAVST